MGAQWFCSGSNGYVRPVVAASPEDMGPEDDIRGLCGVGLELATGQCIAELLQHQYGCLYKRNAALSDEEVAKKEEAKVCLNRTNICCTHAAISVCLERIVILPPGTRYHSGCPTDTSFYSPFA